MTSSFGKEFMEKTRYRYLSPPHQGQGIAQPPLEVEYAHKMNAILLPKPTELSIPDTPLRHIIENRRSIRTYAPTPMDLHELSWLLWATQGIQSNLHGKATFRAVPSAGARHALETYLAVNNVKDLDPGLYRYVASDHKLVEYHLDPDIGSLMAKATLGQQMVRLNAVSFIWTAVPYRMTWRYSERGYRYLHLDVGHVCQNLYLAAANINAGVCAIAAFDDDIINELLRIDGDEQFVIYLASVGKI